jgi:Bacteriodetes cell division protein (FtsL-like)
MENQIKETPETPQPEEKKIRTGQGSAWEVDRYIRYLMFIVAIGIVYVWNSHLAETQLRQAAKLEKEIIEARADYKTMQAKLSSGTLKSALAEKVDTVGLKVLHDHPYILKRKKK